LKKPRRLPQWDVTEDEHGLRLDQFLAASTRTGSRRQAILALERGKVFLNDTEATRKDAGSRLSRGDRVRLWVDRPGSASRRLRTVEAGLAQIVYEDESVIVVNKPAGLLAVPLGRRKDAPSAYDEVAKYLATQRRRPFIVHRIDRDTSGLVLFAKDARAQAALKTQFSRQQPERIYWAIVHGRPRPAQGTWRDHLAWDQAALTQQESHSTDPKGVEAISHYRVLETFAESSLIEVRLQTGKRNQIRAQAGLRGHPLVGEKHYVRDSPSSSFPRQALHAYRLAFRHPTDGRPLSFEASLPADLDDLLTRLRRRRTSEGPR